MGQAELPGQEFEDRLGPGVMAGQVNSHDGGYWDPLVVF